MRYKRVKRILEFWCLFIGIGAIYGSLNMLIDPTGKSLGMDGMLRYFDVLPFSNVLFQDYTFSGISLLIANCITNISAYILLLKNKKLGVVLGMTLKVSAFVRCYHMVNSNIKIYNDKYANLILSKDEYDEIYKNMEKGINNPNYVGDNPVEYIVNNFIGQTVLGRSAVNYKYLLNEIKLGLKQYVILGSGYDTSGYLVNDRVKVFELDKSEVIEDKIIRIKKLI